MRRKKPFATFRKIWKMSAIWLFSNPLSDIWSAQSKSVLVRTRKLPRIVTDSENWPSSPGVGGSCWGRLMIPFSFGTMTKSIALFSPAFRKVDFSQTPEISPSLHEKEERVVSV